MALLSQALHLGYLLSPHSAFQGHAAHTARWPAMLSPNGSSDTCISDGVFHIPMPCFHGALPVTPHGVSTFLHAAFTAHGSAPPNPCQAAAERCSIGLLLSGCVPRPLQASPPAKTASIPAKTAGGTLCSSPAPGSRKGGCRL